jgi:DNA-directed RNA polymerase subunit L
MTSLLSDALGTVVQNGIDSVMSGIPDVVKNMLGGGSSSSGKKEKGGDDLSPDSSSAGSEDSDTADDESKEPVKSGEQTSKKSKEGSAKSGKTGISAVSKPKSKSGAAASTTDVVVAAKSKSSKSSVSAAAATAAAEATGSGARINSHAFAKVGDVHVNKSALHFTLSNAPVSTANALRRIVLSDIQTLVFRTFPHEANRATFHVNTTRHHNEILKQRLSCVPIHISDPDFVHADYECEIHVSNKEDSVMYVTTEHFKVKKRDTGAIIKTWKGREIFPPDPDTGDYIEFARLMPKVADYNEGEELHITANFDMGFAKQDSAFNVCCTCAYGCTPDKAKQDAAWEKIVSEQQKHKSGAATAEEGSGSGSGSGSVHDESLRLQKENWKLLEAQRIVVPNSFDFVIETLGVFTNEEILRKACDIMKIKCETFITAIETSPERNIVPADVTIPNAYNVILRREDYTLGKALEHMLYSKHFLGDRSLTFCAFKKAHPHDDDSYIQLAFVNASDDMIASAGAVAMRAAHDIIAIFEDLKAKF